MVVAKVSFKQMQELFCETCPSHVLPHGERSHTHFGSTPYNAAIKSKSASAMLLLDEFDVKGDGNGNIFLINNFMQQVINKGLLFPLFHTQNKALANELCRMVTYQKIATLPSVLQVPRLEFGDPGWDIVI